MSNQPPGWPQAPRPGLPGDPPPGQPWGTPPEPIRKKRIWPWVLGLLVLLLAMLGACGAAVVGGIFYLTRGPVNATNAFVADLDDGRHQEAYESLCSQTRATLTFEEFQEQFASADAITGYTFTAVSTATGQLTMVSGTIEVNDSPQAISFGLQREDDVWKVCRFDPLD